MGAGGTNSAVGATLPLLEVVVVQAASIIINARGAAIGRIIIRILPVLFAVPQGHIGTLRSEEHTSELQSLMRISYAVFCLKKKNRTHIKYNKKTIAHTTHHTYKQHNK